MQSGIVVYFESQSLVLGRVEVNGYTYFLGRVPSKPLKTLTSRQRRIAKLAGDGYSLQEIARELGIRRPCVAKHLQRVYEKLQVDSRAALANKTIALT